MEKRFIDLEIKMAHQEVKLEELHEVLYKQQETIDLLEKKIQALIQRLETAAPETRKPPHY
jgi:SlyX protein